MEIPRKSLLRSLQGVAQATKIPELELEPVIQLVTACVANTANAQGGTSESLSFDNWYSAVKNNSTNFDQSLAHIASLAVAVSFLSEKCRHDQPASEDELNQCWLIIRDALTCKASSQTLFTAARSAQGFLSVPLCSLVKDGSIDELFRLHVWMPDGKRGNPDFPLHSHQPFAQSWILAGEGVDHSFTVEPVEDAAEATHAGYALAWNDGKGQNATYKTHQSYSIVQNTGKLFKATETRSELHVRGSSYSIPAAAFHASEVAPDALHATLFFFNAHRGFVKDAGVLGPKDGESFTQLRDPAGVTPSELAAAVEAARS
ncbi:hypothetical protein EsH8_X_000618 [Colletotrichum jinshuiense]